MKAVPLSRGKRGPPRSLTPRDAFGVTTAVVLVIAVFGLVIGEPVFIALASVCTAMALWPIVTGRASVFSPWGVLALNIVLSVFIRGILIAIRYPNEEIIDELFIRGEADGFFFWPTLLIVAAVGVAALGYARGQASQVPRSSKFLDRPWNPHRLRPLVWLLSAISLFAFLRFAQATGTPTDFIASIKRSTIPGLEVGDAYQSFGHWRFLAALGRIALLMLAADYFLRPGRVTMRQWLALGCVFAVAALLPLYASSRTAAIWPVVEVAVIWFASGRRLSARRTLVIALIVLVGFQVMSVARSIRNIESPGALVTASVPGESVVLSLNMVGIAKTSHVINAVGESLEPAYGATIASWFIAPVPRAVWPEKPLVQAGPEVGVKVYGFLRSGVPPGLVADLYWNLGAIGVLAGSFGIFLLLGRWFAALAPFEVKRPSRIVLYVVVLFTPTWALLSNGVGSAIYHAAIDGTVLLGLLWLAQIRNSLRAQGSG